MHRLCVIIPRYARGFSSISSGGVDSTALSSKAGASFDSAARLPTHARVVIIGAGVIGSSVAYHLATLGWGRDVLMLDSGRVGGGTTWHAAGLVGQLRATATETQMSGVYGTALCQQLDNMGFHTSFRRTGSITLARSQHRLTHLHRAAARARAFGIEASIISGAEAGELWRKHGVDLITKDLHGALWLPGDGTATSSDVVGALASAAKQRGVVICEKTRVQKAVVKHGKITGVETNKGVVQCEIVVNCSGLWSKQLAARNHVSVPLHAAEHFYIVTRPLTPGVSPLLPIMRDPDVGTYYREWSGGLVMGGFEAVCKPCFMNGPPDDFEFSLLEEDWEHFSPLMEGALERVPALHTAQVRMVNGPESFTPDSHYILGEAPELRKYYVAAGFNSSGIASAGGAGKALAEWIVNDQPTRDMFSVDIRRFAQFHAASSFLRDRTFETLGLHYAISWPKREVASARPARMSPLYDKLKAQGASFGSKFGWERANYFDDTLKQLRGRGDKEPAPQYTFDRPVWLSNQTREHRAARQGVALFDQTSFSKLLIKGRGAEAFLQRVATSNMAVAPGRIVYTALLNERGGVESDCTVTRVSDHEFMLVSSTAQATKDLAWLERQLDIGGEHAQVVDITSAWSVIGVMGPLSRQLLSHVTSTALDNASFPFSSSQMIDIGYARVRASRITYVGELGWELYVPSEFTVHVYDQLQSAARTHKMELTLGGYYAIDSLRIEKGYRAWGHELTSDYNPYESGIGFVVKLDKEVDFIGKAALLAYKQQHPHPSRRVVSLLLDDAAAFPWGDEPVLRNGEVVGQVTSAAFGHTVGRAVALASIKHPLQHPIDAQWLNEGRYEIDINGTKWKVNVSLQPPYDHKSERVKM